MSNSESEGGSSNEWEDRGELAWNEFDWERYLREQDETIDRYLRFYEAHRENPDRIDAVADDMGWSLDDDADPAAGDESAIGDYGDPDDIYTLHKNPIFVSTKAIYRSLRTSWVIIASDPARVPQTQALSLLTSLQQGEEQAMQAIYALDFGDYAMAVSLFKRALSALNGTLALLNRDPITRHRAAVAWRDDALPRLFDLREIWLRVIAECRDELNRPVDGEN
ncbi:MAG: hypothetical protein HZA93_10735 [Verrucomicrobia bacterium]|nr:hypothetical protein [Verrucomicrobiota bacterium]